jgi:ABC-2 type transport system ATP-binding protein
MKLQVFKNEDKFPIIEVNHISKSFMKKNLFKVDNSEILDNINFTLGKPTILSILGENGSGKSTLIKLLLGLISPSTGNIKVLANDPYIKSNQHLMNIGFISGQKRTLNPDLTPKQSITSNALFHDLTNLEIQERLDKYSKLFNITNKINQKTSTLSLGEQIKCEIISSLIHNPKILFLDEPSIGLDFESHEKILLLLKKLYKENKITIIITSHYIRDIKALSKYTLVLKNGKQLYFGKYIDLIKTKNHHNYITKLQTEIIKYN